MNDIQNGNDEQCPRDLGYDPRMYPSEPMDVVDSAKVYSDPRFSTNFLFPTDSVKLPPPPKRRR